MKYMIKEQKLLMKDMVQMSTGQILVRFMSQHCGKRPIQNMEVRLH